MSNQSESNVLIELKANNKRLIEDLSFERNLNNVLENIRNNSLILIEKCKCLTSLKTTQVIKHLNTVYTELKTKQDILRLHQKQNVDDLRPMETTVKSNYHFGPVSQHNQNDRLLTNSVKNKPIPKRLNTKINKIVIKNKRFKTIANKRDLKSKYSLVKEMFEIKDKRPKNRENGETEEGFGNSDSNSIEIIAETIDLKPNLIQISCPELQLSPQFEVTEDNSEELTSYPIKDEEDSHKEIDCNVCDQTFNEKIKLLNHLWKKHKMQAFVCDICRYRTFSIYHLKRHKTSHSSEKPFKCTIDGCDKWFKTKEHLYEHKKLKHSNDTPFECDVCDYKTNRKAAFNYHKNQHSRQDTEPDRPFKCPISGCNKTFKRQAYLDSHKRQTHHKIFDDL